MIGDFTVFKQTTSPGGRGSQSMNVAASSWVILPGEPVMLVAGASACIPAANNLVAISSPFVPLSVTGTGLVGIAQTTSTNTAGAAGFVEIIPANPETVYLINAQTPSLINTQAKYDALVGARVLINLNSAGVVNTSAGGGAYYTALLSDSALNGFIVRPLDVFKFPNKVALSPLTGVVATV